MKPNDVKCTLFYLLILFYFCSLSCCNSSTTLKSLIVLFRHGDRTICNSYPTDPHQDISFWPEGYGQLTNAGKLRLYKLGQWFRQRYDGFIPRNYSVYDIYVRSTDVDRTIMSAYAFLAGLYSPTDEQTWTPHLVWQPIPVHMEKSTKDVILKHFPPCPICPKHSKLFSDLYNTKQFQIIQGKLEDLYTYINHHTGQNCFTLIQLEMFFNLLETEESYGYKLPEWTKDIYPGILKHWAVFASTLACFTPELARFKIGPFLNEIMNHFVNSSLHVGASYQRVRVYSAHDSNIHNILTAMGILNGIPAEFGAAVIFELHRNENGSHFINILYRNSSGIFDLVLRGCEFSCSLDRFIQILEPITIDLETWKKECAIPIRNSALVIAFGYFILLLTCVSCLVNLKLFSL